MQGAAAAGGTADTFSDRQFIVITSEKQARVIALPSQNCVYRQPIADSDYAVKAEVISLKGEWPIPSAALGSILISCALRPPSR